MNNHSKFILYTKDSIIQKLAPIINFFLIGKRIMPYYTCWIKTRGDSAIFEKRLFIINKDKIKHDHYRENPYTIIDFSYKSYRAVLNVPPINPFAFGYRFRQSFTVNTYQRGEDALKDAIIREIRASHHNVQINDIELHYAVFSKDAYYI